MESDDNMVDDCLSDFSLLEAGDSETPRRKDTAPTASTFYDPSAEFENISTFKRFVPKQTVVKNFAANQQSVERLRRRRKELVQTLRDVNPHKTVNQDENEPSYKFNETTEFVKIQPEENESDEDELSPTNNDDKMKRVTRTFSINHMSQKNIYSDDEESTHKIDESYIDIHASDLENLPVKLVENDVMTNFKGAVLEGLTNFNYYLTDTGVMGLLGVKKLDFDNSRNPVQLFNK